jgi:ketosteroid isomerase-like protein
MVRSNRELTRDAFAAWATGTGPVTSIFAPEMRWEIVGRSSMSGSYANTQQFTDEVLHPFGERFDPTAPFRPVRVRGIYADDDQQTVSVVWDGEGTTVAGTTYRNTYAWFLTFEDGKVVQGTAFFDSIAFDELWRGVAPAT